MKKQRQWKGQYGTMLNMSAWSTGRQISILAKIAVVLVVCITVPVLYNKLTTKPTCSDGKQNGLEIGTDCGGACQAMCPHTILPVVIDWARAIPASPGTFHIVAHGINRNTRAIATKIPYRMEIFDGKDRVHRSRGEFSIPPNQTFVIFEQGVPIETSSVSNLNVSIEVDWQRIGWLKYADILPVKLLEIDQIEMLDEKSRPKITAKMRNADPYAFARDVWVVALVYDATKSVVATSRSYVGVAEPSKSQNVVFTWQSPFSGTAPFTIELVPSYVPKKQ